MRVVYAYESLPSEITLTVFLVGPTPRTQGVASWRGEALRVLEELEFSGEVFVPEPRDGRWSSNYADQVRWEDAALQQSDRILVWLPRDMSALPGLTTNDEWGYWKGRDPARLVFGAPPHADQVGYQQYYARQLGIPVLSTLEETCRAAVAEKGALRQGGECQVPLHVWRTESFQSWYTAQKQAGNVLCGARVEWVFRHDQRCTLYWALHVDVYVAAESRHKTNEVVLSRPDVSAVVLYRRNGEYLDTEVVLVSEFRSPARTADGYIWELPGGSSSRSGIDRLATAVEEVEQETGMFLDPQLLKRHESRQLAGTMSTHKAHVFSLELTETQMAELRDRQAAQASYGNRADTEVTHLHVCTLREILSDIRVDWSTLGMILSALQPA